MRVRASMCIAAWHGPWGLYALHVHTKGDLLSLCVPTTAEGLNSVFEWRDLHSLAHLCLRIAAVTRTLANQIKYLSPRWGFDGKMSDP